MPSKSIAQQHLMQAAEHGAEFPMAQKLRQTMSHDQLHDFSVGSEAGKPMHVAPAPSAPAPSAIPSFLKGDSPSIVSSNTSSFKQSGQNEFDATRNALRMASSAKPKGHSNRHLNLGKFLHPKKG